MLKILRRLLGDRRANVTVMVAIAAVPLFLSVAIALDITNQVRVKSRLQDATDAASLAVSAAVAKNPNMTVAELRTVAQSLLNANFSQYPSVIGEFHVCAPVQNDCKSASAGTMKMDTVLLSTTADAPCPMLSIAGGNTCGKVGATLPVTAQNVAVIGLGAAIQMNIAMDSSASMIVGATDADVQLIATWVSANWSQVKPLDPNQQSDNKPCAFACHDLNDKTTPADINAGLTNAHKSGATTRYDVMIAAAQQLVSHIQTISTNSNELAKYNYAFNVYSFDRGLHQYMGDNLNYSDAQKAIQSVTLGMDTYLSNVPSGVNAKPALPDLVTDIGKNGSGISATSPIKFLILVTDGLESDRSANWGTPRFDKPISVAQCAQFKNNGIVLGVLETPYVPLNGQSPIAHPYESTVAPVIYPGGKGSPSTVSAALQACASTGYYFQATSPADIATGFITLADRFIAAQTHLAS